MDVIRLSPGLYDQMMQHAQRAAPMEAVGLLGGKENGRASALIPLTNVAGPKAFLADPFGQFQAERRLAQDGLHLLAIYHSHPGGGVMLSDADKEFARRWPCAQIVIAVDRPDAYPSEIRAYRVLSPDNLTDVTIELIELG